MITMNKRVSLDDLSEQRDAQLALWPLAKENYSALGRVETKVFRLGDFPMMAMHNPARMKSTGAAVDKKSIEERPCFLCRDNRPEQQLQDTILPGWDFLVNPYPILPMHFTIVSTRHVPQSGLPLEAASMAEMMPGMTVFFNGARAGASAPDHLHLQAVMASELPLLRIAEDNHPSGRPGIMSSDYFGLDLPFGFFSAVITPDDCGMRTLAAVAKAEGVDAVSEEPDPGLVNTFLWIDKEGLLRAVVVPRSAHRPSCYFKDEPDKMVISPGALDMAGIMVVPRREDFERLDIDGIKEIYSETGCRLK